MDITITLRYGSTFRIHEARSNLLVGEISLMGNGWAAYLSNAPRTLLTSRRIGTYASAELAISALKTGFQESA